MKAICILTVLLLTSTLIFAQNDKAFIKDLEALKGKTYYGKAIFMPDTTKSNDFWGKKLSFSDRRLYSLDSIKSLLKSNRTCKI